MNGVIGAPNAKTFHLSFGAKTFKKGQKKRVKNETENIT